MSASIARPHRNLHPQIPELSTHSPPKDAQHFTASMSVLSQNGQRTGRLPNTSQTALHLRHLHRHSRMSRSSRREVRHKTGGEPDDRRGNLSGDFQPRLERRPQQDGYGHR